MQHLVSPADLLASALELRQATVLVSFESGAAPSVTLYDYDSQPLQAMGGTVTSRKVRVQARVRAMGYAEAYALAEQTANAILAAKVPNMHQARWINGPLPIGQDQNGNDILTLNFEFTYRRTA